MEIRNEKVILRDFVESDIDDWIHWQTVEKEWQLWDAPWEYDEGAEPFMPEQYRKKMLDWLAVEKDESRMRWAFQICKNNTDQTHIGLCNSYRIDSSFDYTQGEGFRAIGIDIPPLHARGCGYGTAAWTLFIEYLISCGIDEIYTQTWSGNGRLIRLAEKLGFEECNREPNVRKVQGKFYDALTYRLNMEKFYGFAATYDKGQ